MSSHGRFGLFVIRHPEGVAAGDDSAELSLYRTLSRNGISINLVKLFPGGLTFIVEERDGATAADLLSGAQVNFELTPSVSMVLVQAGGMRQLHGVMARISEALLRAGAPILQTGDGPDTVFVLVATEVADRAVAALRAEFGVEAPRRPIVVQKFGGKSVGTAENRLLAAERVREVVEAGERPVVVVSAIGRRGEPYATDTLLEQLQAVEPSLEAPARERDMLLACGEIISTVIMAQTLKRVGVRAVALTGGQAGIHTDDRHGDAQILRIRPEPILDLLERDDVDAIVVAGFQGETRSRAFTTLGRGGSDTTAAALGAALNAARVEIYTHVDGVMTADPELVPEAKTLPLVTYEEVSNLAHLGAKVLHPRAAEIAMKYQIPLWVKSSLTRSPGTRVAPLGEMQPAAPRSVSGVASLPGLVYYTVTLADPAGRAEAECAIFRAVGEAGINFYLNSTGPETTSFLVDEAHADQVRAILDGQGLAYRAIDECEMVSVVALRMWDQPGFLLRIAETFHSEGIPRLQMADSEGTVSCLVARRDGPAAVRALHATILTGEPAR